MPGLTNGAANGLNGTGAVVDTAALQQFGKAHMVAAIARLSDHIIVKGRGLDVWTTEGKQLLDMTAGIGVTNLGHCHPAVTEAAVAQVQQMVHAQCSIYLSLPYLQLIERLLKVMPDPSLDAFFLWNSGTEANEMAIKLVRQATKRQNIICMQGGYHGRTAGSSAISRSKAVYTQSSGPSVMGGVFSCPFPYWHSLGLPPSTPVEECVRIAKHHLDMLLRQQTAPHDTAAIFVEPVIGEGGYVPAPASWLMHLRQVADKIGALLVVDEVQTGFGRTGRYFAVEHTPGFVPDVLVFAKGVANGFPLSGVASRKELMDRLDMATVGGTYAGNAVACAAGVACADVMAKEDILGNVRARSEELINGLKKLAASPKTSHLIAEVRGLGLMVAVEFRNGEDSLTLEGVTEGKAIPKTIGKRVQAKCLEKGLVTLTTSCFDVVRFIPALIVTEQQIAQALAIITESVNEVALEG